MFRRRAGYSRVVESAGAHGSAAAGDDSCREESSRLLGRGAEREDRSRYASKVSSSLSLQILMYYNVLLSAVYFFLEGGLVINKVPHMCAFLLTTFFPQMFCLLFLAFFQEHRFPADPIIGSISIGFLASEMAVGYYGIKAIINKRTAQFFRVAQEEYVSRREHGDHPRFL